MGNYWRKHSSLGNRKVVIMYVCMYKSREKRCIASFTNEHTQLKEMKIFLKNWKYFQEGEYFFKV